MLRWPGHVAAGPTDERFVANIDIAPSILEPAGLLPDAEYPIDGRSLIQAGSRAEAFTDSPRPKNSIPKLGIHSYGSFPIRRVLRG